jgi:predicted nucleotidyltransferase
LKSVEECYRGRNVRVFRLDSPALIARLRERARELIERRPDVVAVWLFGSLARGQAHPGSDADLFVIVRGDGGPFLERGAGVARAFEGSGVGCDVIVYTEPDVQAAQTRGDAFVRTVFDEGLLLAARDA